MRVHGNKKRLPSSTTSPETIEEVVKFITNVAEDQALLLPGCVPGFKRIDVKLLPSTLMKHSLWKTYQNLLNSTERNSVGYSKFCDLWKQLCPFLVIIMMRPATDLCWTCQKNNNGIHKSANLPDTQKAEVVRAQEEHLRLAAGEREYYKLAVKNVKTVLRLTWKTLILAMNGNHAVILEWYTIHTIMRNNCTTQQTHISLNLYISKPQENALSSGYATRALRDKCIT